MTDDTEFRESVKRIVRKHDPDPDELRSLASDLTGLAEKWETANDTL